MMLVLEWLSLECRVQTGYIKSVRVIRVQFTMNSFNKIMSSVFNDSDTIVLDGQIVTTEDVLSGTEQDLICEEVSPPPSPVASTSRQSEEASVPPSRKRRTKKTETDSKSHIIRNKKQKTDKENPVEDSFTAHLLKDLDELELPTACTILMFLKEIANGQINLIVLRQLIYLYSQDHQRWNFKEAWPVLATFFNVATTTLRRNRGVQFLTDLVPNCLSDEWYMTLSDTTACTSAKNWLKHSLNEIGCVLYTQTTSSTGISTSSLTTGNRISNTSTSCTSVTGPTVNASAPGTTGIRGQTPLGALLSSVRSKVETSNFCSTIYVRENDQSYKLESMTPSGDILLDLKTIPMSTVRTEQATDWWRTSEVRAKIVVDRRSSSTLAQKLQDLLDEIYKTFEGDDVTVERTKLKKL